MGDQAEHFRAMRERDQDRRATNRMTGADALTVARVSFEEKNGGAHLIVSHAGRIVDFWPGTERWIERGSNRRGHGVANLLDRLGVLS